MIPETKDNTLVNELSETETTGLVNGNDLTEKQKDRLKNLACRAGISYEEVVSKNMSQKRLKKMIKKENYLKILQSKRKEEKDRRKKFRKERRDRGESVPKIKRTHVLMKDSSNKMNIAIDFNFNHLMTDKDAKKLRKQVLRCYSFNRASDTPCQLYLTSISSPIQEYFESMKCGFENWDVYVSQDEYIKTFLDKGFERKDIVYLTRDSDNVLPSSEELVKEAGKKVYIIGGLVDHNTHKGLTLKMANQEGISHARLPIQEHMKMLKTQVLTVNHVFELMLLVSQSTPWPDALKTIIPMRKVHPDDRNTKQETGSSDSSDDDPTQEKAVDEV